MFLPWSLFAGCGSYCIMFLIFTIVIYFNNKNEKTAMILGIISGSFFMVSLSAYLYDKYHINQSRTVVKDPNSLTSTNLPQTLDFEHYSDTYTYVTKVPWCDICQSNTINKLPITHKPTRDDGYSYPYSETVKKYYHVDCAFNYLKQRFNL